MTSPFIKIISGQEPHRIIAQENTWIAFLEENPLAVGHAVVIPNFTEGYLFDLSDEALSQMMVFSKKIAIAMKKVIPCEKIGVAVIGLQARHAHIHLVPINSADDLNFTRARPTQSAEALSEVAKKIINSLN